MTTTLAAAGAGSDRAGFDAEPGRVAASIVAAGRVLVAILTLGMLLLAGLVLGARLAGWHPYVVYSGSMEPAIPVGAVTLVQPAPLDRLKARDVITFSRPSQPEVPITHRVVSVDRLLDGGGWRIVTRGDANPEPDVWTVDGNHVVGRVAFTFPWLGYLLVWLASSAGKLLLLGLIAVAFVFNLVARRVGDAEGEP